jgi:hypothetical protein
VSTQAAELVARVFAVRTAAHFAHLTTKSYAQHVALEAFYEDVIDKADAFIECFQGVFGPVKNFPDVPLPKGGLAPIAELREWLHSNRTGVCKGQRELENLVDEITSVCDRAIYKLTQLA